MKSWSLLLSLLAVCLTHGSAQTTDPTPLECYLQGYDIATLSRRDYWTFDIPTKDQNLGWFIPEGVLTSEIASVDVSMAFCKTLPKERCNIDSKSSFCQHLHLKNGSIIDVDLGDFSNTQKFVALTGNVTGFYLTSHGDVPTDSTRCKGNVSTVLTFTCSPFSRWNGQNVTSHVVRAEHTLGCGYEIEMVYNGSCYSSPTVSPSSCQIEGYDTKTISSAPYWFVETEHTACFNGSEDDKCTILFSFCHAIPADDTHFNLEACHEASAAVCQVGHTEDGGKNLEYSMGMFHDYTIFKTNVNPDRPGFHMEVSNGSKPNNGSTCPHGLSTKVNLICEPDSEWPEDSRDLTFFVHTYYLEGCQYVLEMEYSGACIGVLPISDTPSPVGWIFIGLFLFALAVYMLVGMAFQYFVKGARGKDIVPNYTFWTGLVGLIGDGFKFTLDVITCFRLKGGTAAIRKPTGSSGVQYDQI